MSRSANCRHVRLGDVLKVRKEIVHPRDKPTGRAIFVGLEHLESGTGRRIGSSEIRLEELTGRKPRFYENDIVYGYLRPYLNKVWLAEFDGLCSVDQYVFQVNGELAEPEFVSSFMRSPVYLSRAPIDISPGQLPRIRTDEVAAVEIDLPPLDDQRLLIVKFRNQTEATSRARSAAAEQLASANVLQAQILSAIFRAPTLLSKLVRLGDLGASPEAFADGPFGSNLKTEHYSDEGARVIRLQNIGSGVFLDDDRAYVPMDHFEKLQRHRVEAGDVIVAALGDGARPAGRACVVPRDFGPGLVKADCFRLRLSRDAVRSEYLVAYLNSPGTLKRMAASMRGATRPRLTLSMIRDLVVPIPPLAQQERTVTSLEQLSETAEKLRTALQATVSAFDALPASLLGRAFGGI